MSEPKTHLRRAIDRHYDGSIAAAARRLGIDDVYLGRIIRGVRQPTLAMARRIAELLGVSVQGVLGAAPPAETRAERMARRRKSDPKFRRALAAAQQTPAHRRRMRAAGAVGNASPARRR